jgi:predicted ester cyclase
VSEHSSSEHKDLVRELYRTLYEEQSFDSVPEFYASGATRHGGLQGSVEGREALQGYLQAALGGFSEIEITELHCLAEDDIVAYDFEMAVTHSGEMLGIPATGNRFEITNAALFRIDDGYIVDEWPRTDMLGLMEGIGAVDLPF